jgi:hypothetical protein
VLHCRVVVGAFETVAFQKVTVEPDGIREQIDALIDERVEAERAQCPGVLAGVLRNLITARSGGCNCEAWLQIAAKEEA